MITPTELAPFAVYLDWLTVGVHAPLALFPARPVTWKWTEGHADNRRLYWCPGPPHIRPRHFGKVAQLKDGAGVVLATLIGAPYSHEIHHPEAGQLQFANVTLYTSADGLPLWLHLWELFQRTGVRYTGLSRVDIAFDGLADHGGDFQQVMERALLGGEGKYYGKGHWKPHFHRSKIGGFEMGTRSSNKYIRCYNKTIEIKAKGRSKPYIEQAWQMVLGCDPIREGLTVNRLELQTKGKEVRRYFPEEQEHTPSGSPVILERLAGQQYRAELAASMVSTVFDFRTHAARARNALPLARWDWSRVACELELAERDRKRLQLSERSVKTAVRVLYFRFLATGDPKVYAAALDLVHAVGPVLSGWFRSAQERWRIEAEVIARDPRGLNVFDQGDIGLGSSDLEITEPEVVKLPNQLETRTG